MVGQGQTRRRTPTTSNAHTVTSSTTSPQLKFRPPTQLDTNRRTAKGTKPLPSPESVSEVFTRVALYGCKRLLFIEPKIRLTYYAVLLFLVSLIGDYFPIPKSYFSNSDNVPNQYFVKLSWAWTFTLTSAFVYFTTAVTCCGNRKLMTRHASRLVIATIIWYIWTNLFAIIEESTGHCVFVKNATSAAMPRDTVTLYSKTRKACRSGGGKWTSFDISGHSFLLMWCILFITEECKAIIGWDTIPHLLLNEEYRRKTLQSMGGTSSSEDGGISDTAISHLTPEEFEILKQKYHKFNVWAKINLIVLTALTLLWDIMLIATAIYFHVMIEKVIAGFLCAIIWFCTYKGLYAMTNLSFSPGLPGSAHFKYNQTSSTFTSNPSKPHLYSPTWPVHAIPSTSRTKTAVPKDEGPKFLGMPLNPLNANVRTTRSSTRENIGLDKSTE